MFLLNTLAVNGVINWTAVKQRLTVEQINMREVTVPGKKKEIYPYTDMTFKYPNAVVYRGAIKRPDLKPSILELCPRDEITSLMWEGDQEPPSTNIKLSTERKIAYFNKDGTIVLNFLSSSNANSGGLVEINGKKIFITSDDTRKPANEIEAYSVKEALFLIEKYLKILEQIQVPEETSTTS